MLTSKWHTLNANCQKFKRAYKRAKRLGKSGENDVDYLKRAQSIYRDEIDGGREDLFGHDARPRPPGKQRPAKKSKSDATASTGGSSASAQFGELMEQELRLKREAAERAFEAQAEKDRTLMRLEELRFALQLHESAGGLLSLKLSLHSCSLSGSTNAMGIETFIALVLPAREHECDTSFVLRRPPALS
ncbi:hypothetical protein Tco_0007851 [Tanacetum coccineum]